MSAGVDRAIADEIASMLELYGDPKASAARVFCDRHDPSHVAYTIVAQDTSARELTYGDAFLHSQAAKTIFEKYGFTFLVRPSS